MENFIGKKVIVRGDRSGVFYGTLVAKNGSEVELHNFRKLHYWDGAGAVEQLAVDGTSKPNNCRFTVWVEKGIIEDEIQILECTDKAIKSLEEVKEWKK
jgi:acylphosphatase